MTRADGGSEARAAARLGRAALRADKRRFAGTFLAVLLGVAFLSGTLVMGDTLRAGFGTLFGSAADGTDAVVRSADVITAEGRGRGTREPVATELATTLTTVAGVAAAEPAVQGAGQLIGRNGKPVGGTGPPTLAGNWITDARLNPYRIAQGRPPRAPGEAVVNRGAAEEGRLKVGDSTVLRTPDPVRIMIVGIATFNGGDGLARTTFTALTRADAEKYLTGGPGRAAYIQVRAGPGVSQQQLVDALAPALPRGIEAVTGEQWAAENLDQISGTFLSLFTTLLLVFAGISLLVATFSIHNTCAIVVAQRTRENALLRTLGASRGQLTAATLAEAAVVAGAASALGLLAGLGIAAGLRSLFPALGFPFPEGELTVSWLSLALPLAVGVVVTLASALLPAVRAGRTAPMAALREVAIDASGASRTRARLGEALGAAGLVLTAFGAAGTRDIYLAGGGALLTLVAFVVLGPVVASRAVRILGGPLVRARGVTGALARRNALRSPRRTAATAGALMIGVAVVSLFAVFGASLKATMDHSVSRAFAGDVAISAATLGPGGSGLSTALAPAVSRLPEVEAALGLGRGVAEVDGSGRQLTVTDPAALGRVLDLGEVRGSLAGLGATGLAVSRDEAARHGWRPGSTAELAFADGARQRFTVRAVYERADLAGTYVITRGAWQPHSVQDADTLVAVAFKDGIPLEQGKAAVQRAADAYGSPQVQTRQEYAAAAAGGIDMFLTLVYALLALAVVIALLGIANTLTLALHERTRELGLLRAVGQSRAQLRAMVRWESVLVAAFGTAGGLALGAFLGWALVRASDRAQTGVFALPATSLAVVALVGLAAGALAGLRPAHRAARLNVLRAIATE